MGVAASASPMGPWARRSTAVLMPEPGGFEQGIANNPAIVQLVDGSLSITYRGRADMGYGNCAAPSWGAPCTRPLVNLFNGDSRWWQTEDPFTFHGPRGYILIAHNTNGTWADGRGVKAVSRDGVHWTWASDEAYPYTQQLANGTAIVYARREEPKLLLEGGRPTALFNAVYEPWAGGFSRIIVQEVDWT